MSDPVFVLEQLSNKLKDDGKLFIDTPKQFWIFPLTKFISKKLYKKVLNGTVSKAHLQIWTKKSFKVAIERSEFAIIKYAETNEYTMPPEFYLRNMQISNPILKLAGRIYYKSSKYIAENKILCLISK